MSIKIIRQALESERLTINPLDDGSGVVVDVEAEQLLTMNASGLAIIQAISDGLDDPAGIAERLTTRFQVDTPQACTDVNDFLEQVSGALR